MNVAGTIRRLPGYSSQFIDRNINFMFLHATSVMSNRQCPRVVVVREFQYAYSRYLRDIM